MLICNSFSLLILPGILNIYEIQHLGSFPARPLPSSSVVFFDLCDTCLLTVIHVILWYMFTNCDTCDTVILWCLQTVFHTLGTWDSWDSLVGEIWFAGNIPRKTFFPLWWIHRGISSVCWLNDWLTLYNLDTMCVTSHTCDPLYIWSV